MKMMQHPGWGNRDPWEDFFGDISVMEWQAEEYIYQYENQLPAPPPLPLPPVPSITTPTVIEQDALLHYLLQEQLSYCEKFIFPSVYQYNHGTYERAFRHLRTLYIRICTDIQLHIQEIKILKSIPALLYIVVKRVVVTGELSELHIHIEWSNAPQGLRTFSSLFTDQYDVIDTRKIFLSPDEFFTLTHLMSCCCFGVPDQMKAVIASTDVIGRVVFQADARKKFLLRAAKKIIKELTVEALRTNKVAKQFV